LQLIEALRRHGARELTVISNNAGVAEEGIAALLRDRLDVRIAEHDGGRTVMAKFAAAGALDQLHLTLMRDRSLRTVLDALPSEDRPRSPDPAASASVFFPGDGRLPPALEPISLLAGTGEALVACLDARGWNGA
jgi:hypothetical protein